MNNEIIDKAIDKFQQEIYTLELCISALTVEKIKLINSTPNSPQQCNLAEERTEKVTTSAIPSPEDTIQSKHKAEIDKDYEKCRTCGFSRMMCDCDVFNEECVKEDLGVKHG